MYIDPSSGGMLFQVLAIAFTAISGFVLIFANRIKMFFSKLRRGSDSKETEVQDENTENT
jgi:hypothetical protein